MISCLLFIGSIFTLIFCLKKVYIIENINPKFNKIIDKIGTIYEIKKPFPFNQQIDSF